MSDVREQYTDEMYDNFGYYATWEPGTIRKIGEVGELTENEFVKLSSLENLGIQFKVTQDEVKHEISYSSKGSVSITQKVAGKAIPQASAIGEAEAGFVVEFGKEKAVMFKAMGVSTEQIDDQIALRNDILKLYNEGKWDKKWVVITELKHAESATILISDSANSKIELTAKGNVGTDKLNIADADLGLNIVASSGISTEIIAKKNLTPLFRLRGIKKSLFGKTELANKNADRDGDKENTGKDKSQEKVDFGEIERIKKKQNPPKK